MYLRMFHALALLATLATGPAHALDAPSGGTVLTIDGAIAATNDGDRAVFDLAMLRSLDWQEIESHTPYTEGPQTFAGPTLASLLDMLGVSDGTLVAIALNDYTIDIPVSDARDFGVLLAVEHNGTAMRTREKGPIWVIYPSDGLNPLPDAHGSRMIWQLTRITVKP